MSKHLDVKISRAPERGWAIATATLGDHSVTRYVGLERVDSRFDAEVEAARLAIREVLLLAAGL